MNIHTKLHPLCLDNDPQFIILELMEGGDLLSFMRACRLSSVRIANSSIHIKVLLFTNIHAKLHPLCLDNDPQFIILELMEGGDLISFMRACRLSSVSIVNSSIAIKIHSLMNIHDKLHPL